MDAASDHEGTRLRELAAVFLKLGTIGFGGPAAHIAMMHDEVVTRRKWMADDAFADLLGATNLIPGPNSTEMAIHIGHHRAGRKGLVVAGLCFILPAFLIVLALAWAYVAYGSTPQAAWLLYGIKPVIIAIVVQAIWRLRKPVLKGTFTIGAALAALALYLLGRNELFILFGLGLVVLLWSFAYRRSAALGILPLAGPGLAGPGLAGAASASFLAASGPNLVTLFLVFLKVGSLLYGSGYVLLAFLQGDLVDRLGWLTQTQLLDAVGIGQLIPGPVFTTATFIGYVLGSWQGAILATVAIFLPAFVFVALTHPFIPKLRANPWIGSFLDGVNAAALGLMAAVTLELGGAALVDPLTIALALVSVVILVRFQLNSAWLVAGGAAIGLAYALATGQL